MDSELIGVDLHDRAGSLIAQRDISIFGIESQTSDGDKRSLLALQGLVRQRPGGYAYLEVGSFVGGTLYPHLADPNCRFACSIDKRPPSQPDERGICCDYPDNTTKRMIDTLRTSLPPASMNKLTTYDGDISTFPRDVLRHHFDLVFIDAEHTNKAAFHDFLHCLKYAKEKSIIAMHDAWYIFDALSNIEEFLEYQEAVFRTYLLPDVVFACLLGEHAEIEQEALARMSLPKAQKIVEWQENLWVEVASRRRSTG